MLSRSFSVPVLWGDIRAIVDLVYQHLFPHTWEEEKSLHCGWIWLVTWGKELGFKMMLKFFFVGWTCKFQTHKAPSVQAVLVLVIQTSLNTGFLTLKVRGTAATEYLAIQKKISDNTPLVADSNVYRTWCFSSKVTTLLVSVRSCYESTISWMPSEDVEAEQPLITPLKIWSMFFTEVPGNANKNIYL